LRTEFVKRWLGNEARAQESRSDEPAIGRTKIGGQDMPVLRFMGFPPNVDASGEIESMNLLAGQSVGLVQEILSAGELSQKIMKEADGIVSQWVDSGSRKAEQPTLAGVGEEKV
jgi:nitronate monooxygenase